MMDPNYYRLSMEPGGLNKAQAAEYLKQINQSRENKLDRQSKERMFDATLSTRTEPQQPNYYNDASPALRQRVADQQVSQQYGMVPSFGVDANGNQYTHWLAPMQTKQITVGTPEEAQRLRDYYNSPEQVQSRANSATYVGSPEDFLRRYPRDQRSAIAQQLGITDTANSLEQQVTQQWGPDSKVSGIVPNTPQYQWGVRGLQNLGYLPQGDKPITFDQYNTARAQRAHDELSKMPGLDLREAPSGDMSISNAPQAKKSRDFVNQSLANPENIPDVSNPNQPNYGKYLQGMHDQYPTMTAEGIKKQYGAGQEGQYQQSNPKMAEKDAEAQRSENDMVDTQNRIFNYAILKDNDPATARASKEMPQEAKNRASRYDSKLGPTIQDSQDLMDFIREKGVPQAGPDRDKYLQKVKRITSDMVFMNSNGGRFPENLTKTLEAMQGDPEGVWARLSPAEAQKRIRDFQNAVLYSANSIYGGPYKADYDKLAEEFKGSPELYNRIKNRQFQGKENYDPYHVHTTYTHTDGTQVSKTIPLDELPNYSEKARRWGGSFQAYL